MSASLDAHEQRAKRMTDRMCDPVAHYVVPEPDLSYLVDVADPEQAKKLTTWADWHAQLEAGPGLPRNLQHLQAPCWKKEREHLTARNRIIHKAICALDDLDPMTSSRAIIARRCKEEQATRKAFWDSATPKTPTPSPPPCTCPFGPISASALPPICLVHPVMMRSQTQ